MTAEVQATASKETQSQSWFARLPIRMKAWANRVFSVNVLPNESKVRFVVRKIFEILAALFIFVATLPTLPVLFLGYFIYWLTEPPKQYTIGSNETYLTDEMLLHHLQAVITSQRQLQHIEIINQKENASFEMSEEACRLLRKAQPQRVTLTNIPANPETLKKLESERHYYVIDSKASSEQGQFQLALREKITRHVLPNDPDAMLTDLKDLADREVRIVTLFFTCYRPKHLTELIDKYIDRLGPPILICQLHQNYGRSPAELEALLS